MKKAILMAFLAAGTAFTSCSKDDDGAEQDRLIGEWTLTNSTTTFEGEVNQESISGCDRENVTAEFRLDGTFTTGKFEGSAAGICEDSKGLWENLGDSNYQIEEDGDVSTQNIVFSGDTFTITTEPGEEGEFSTVVYSRMK